MSLKGKKIMQFSQMNQAVQKKSVHADIRIQIPENKLHEALMTLDSVIELIKLEEGCVSCRLYQDLRDGALLLEQVWSSQSDLERHLRSDRLHTVLLVVEMAVESPEIRFDVIEQTTGMETIKKIRKKPLPAAAESDSLDRQS
jgi:quinol monooxygenase YgiN